MDSNTRRKSNYILTVICLTVLGIALNVLGGRIGAKTGMFIIPENLGTILVSVFGGVVPGVLSGFLSSVVLRIFEPDALYFCVVYVLVALVAGIMRSRRAFRSFIGSVCAVFAVFLVQFVPGMLISWLLYGFGGDRYASLERRLLEAGAPGEYAAHLFTWAIVCACTVILCFAVTLVVYTLVPGSFKKKIWSAIDPDGNENKLAVRRPLTRKVVAIVLTVEILLGLLAFAVGFILYREAAMRNYESTCRSVTETLALSIDAERVDDYIEFGHAAPDYDEVEDELVEVQNCFPLVKYVYVYRIEDEGCRVVFDPDPDGLAPGELQEFDESFDELLPTLKAGGEIDPIVTDDTYGYLLTVYTPLKDQNGECVCYVCADISMEDVVTDEQLFAVKLTSTFFGVSIVVMMLVLEIVTHTVVSPLNKMARAAGDFAFNEDEKRNASLARLEALDLRSHDELGNLYESLTKMATDSAGYIDEVKAQASLISKMQQEIIVDFADMVEARDKCTGDHIKNTSAYVEAIAKELRREGAFGGVLTDEFIARLERSAPLHDIGKIKISDMILNKPGKLTDDEFALMKTHTVEGKDILEHSSALATASGYLDQAIEMANYHHERWDGKGYPTGAAGDQIPLSARIMAVADVFDALVSQRSYKKPFTFDEAMNIINEESGTHFDPVVVAAFDKIAREVYDKMVTEGGANAANGEAESKE